MMGPGLGSAGPGALRAPRKAATSFFALATLLTLLRGAFADSTFTSLTVSTCLALKTVTLSPAFAGGTSGGTSTFTATVDHECSLWQPTTDVNGNYTITSPYSLSAWLTWACVDPTCAVEVDLYGPNPNGGADMVVASYPSSSTTVTGNQTNYPPSGLALQTATQVTSTPPTSPPTSNLVAVDDVVTRIDIHSTVSGVKTTYTLNITRHGRSWDDLLSSLAVLDSSGAAFPTTPYASSGVLYQGSCTAANGTYDSSGVTSTTGFSATVLNYVVEVPDTTTSVTVKAIGDTIGTLNATTLFQRILMYSDATGAATGYCGSTCLHGSDIYTTPGCSTSCTNNVTYSGLTATSSTLAVAQGALVTVKVRVESQAYQPLQTCPNTTCPMYNNNAASYRTYTIQILRRTKSANAQLSALALTPTSTGDTALALSPTFAGGMYTYTAPAYYRSSALKFTATVPATTFPYSATDNVSRAAITVQAYTDGTFATTSGSTLTLVSGTQSTSTLPLATPTVSASASTYLRVSVTSEDGSTTHAYQVTVTRAAPSSDSTLSQIHPSVGWLVAAAPSGSYLAVVPAYPKDGYGGSATNPDSTATAYAFAATTTAYRLRSDHGIPYYTTVINTANGGTAADAITMTVSPMGAATAGGQVLSTATVGAYDTCDQYGACTNTVLAPSAAAAASGTASATISIPACASTNWPVPCTTLIKITVYAESYSLDNTKTTTYSLYVDRAPQVPTDDQFQDLYQMRINNFATEISGASDLTGAAAQSPTAACSSGGNLTTVTIKGTGANLFTAGSSLQLYLEVDAAKWAATWVTAKQTGVNNHNNGGWTAVATDYSQMPRLLFNVSVSGASTPTIAQQSLPSTGTGLYGNCPGMAVCKQGWCVADATVSVADPKGSGLQECSKTISLTQLLTASGSYNASATSTASLSGGGTSVKAVHVTVNAAGTTAVDACNAQVTFTVAYGQMSLPSSAVGLTEVGSRVATAGALTLTGKDQYGNTVTGTDRAYATGQVAAAVCTPRQGLTDSTGTLARALVGDTSAFPTVSDASTTSPSPGKVAATTPPRMAVDRDGNVVVAWVDDSSLTLPAVVSGQTTTASVTGAVQVKRYSAALSAWQSMGAFACRSSDTGDYTPVAVNGFDLYSTRAPAGSSAGYPDVVLAYTCNSLVFAYELDASGNTATWAPMSPQSGNWSSSGLYGALSPTCSPSCGGTAQVQVSFGTDVVVCHQERSGTTVSSTDISLMPSCYQYNSLNKQWAALGPRGVNTTVFTTAGLTWSSGTNGTVTAVAVITGANAVLLTYSTVSQTWGTAYTFSSTSWTSVQLYRTREATPRLLLMGFAYNSANPTPPSTPAVFSVTTGTPSAVTLPHFSSTSPCAATGCTYAGVSNPVLRDDASGRLMLFAQDQGNSGQVVMLRDLVDNEWEEIHNIFNPGSDLAVGEAAPTGTAIYVMARGSFSANTSLDQHLLVKRLGFADRTESSCSCPRGYTCAAPSASFTANGDGTYSATAALTSDGWNLVFVRASTTASDLDLSAHPTVLTAWAAPSGGGKAATYPYHVRVTPGAFGQGSTILIPSTAFTIPSPWPQFYLLPQDAYGNLHPTGYSVGSVALASVLYDTTNSKGPEGPDHTAWSATATYEGSALGAYSAITVAANTADLTQVVVKSYRAAIYNVGITVSGTALTSPQSFLLRAGEISDWSTATYWPSTASPAGSIVAGDPTTILVDAEDIWQNPIKYNDNSAKLALHAYILDSATSPTCQPSGGAVTCAAVSATALAASVAMDPNARTNGRLVVSFTAPTDASKAYGFQVVLTGLTSTDLDVNGVANTAKIGRVLPCAGCTASGVGSMLNASNLTQRMVQIQVNPNVPVPVSTLLDYATSQVAGKVQFKLSPRDAYGNFSPTTRWKLVVTPTAISADAGPAPAGVPDTKTAIVSLSPFTDASGQAVAGTQLFDFTQAGNQKLVRIGTYQLTIFLQSLTDPSSYTQTSVTANGVVIPVPAASSGGSGSTPAPTSTPPPTMSLTVVPDQPSGNSTVSSLPALIRVGQQIVLYIGAVDQYGNRIRTGGQLATVAVKLVNLNDPSVVVTASVADSGDGNYIVQFQLSQAGKYRLTSFFNGVQQPAQQDVEAIAAGQPSGQVASVVSLPAVGGIYVAQVDEPFTVALVADKTQPLAPQAALTVTATLKFQANGGTQEQAVAFGQMNAQGRWMATVTPQASGVYSMEVSVGGSPVFGSPFAIQAQSRRARWLAAAKAASASTTWVPPTMEVETLASSSLTAGDTLTLFVNLRDKFGNSLTVQPRQEARVYLVRQSDNTILDLDLATSDATGGWGSPSTTHAVLRAQATLTVPGTYSLYAYFHELRVCNPGKAVSSLDASKLPCLPDITVAAGALDLTQTTLFGSGVADGTVGATMDVRMHPRDAYGNILPATAGSALSAKLTVYGPFATLAAAQGINKVSASTLTASPVAMTYSSADRTLVAQYSATGASAVGYYVVDVGTYNASGTRLAQVGSDVVVHLSPGLPYYNAGTLAAPSWAAATSTCAVQAASVSAGEQNQLTVTPSRETLSVRAANLTVARVSTDLSAYTVAFQGMQAGTHTLQLWVGGVQATANGCPASVTVTAAPPDPAWTFAYGEALSRVKAGDTATVYVRPVDRFGNQVTSKAQVDAVGLTFTLERQTYRGLPADLPDSAPAYVWLADPAVYQVQFTAKVVGRLQLRAELGGTSLGNMPVTPVMVPGDPYLPNTVVFGGGVQAGSVSAQASFTVELLDAYRNPGVAAGQPVWVEVVAADSATRSAMLTSNSSLVVAPIVTETFRGYYSVQYSVPVQGNYTVTVLYGTSVVQSYSVQVGDGCIGPTTSAGACAVKDINTYVPSAANSKVDPVMRDTVAGVRQEEVIMAVDEVGAGSSLQAGGSASSFVAVMWLDDGVSTANSPTYSAKATTPLTVTPSSPLYLLNYNNGTFSLNYAPTKAGKYFIDLFGADGSTPVSLPTSVTPNSNLSSYPRTVDVFPAATDATKSTLSAATPLPSGLAAGKAFDIRVTPRDAYGNVQTGFGDHVMVLLEGQSGQATGITFEYDLSRTHADYAAKDYDYKATVPGLQQAGQWRVRVFMVAADGSQKLLADGQNKAADQTVLVTAGAVSPGASFVHGPGLQGGVAGRQLEVFVEVRDQYLNPIDITGMAATPAPTPAPTASATPAPTAASTPAATAATPSGPYLPDCTLTLVPRAADGTSQALSACGGSSVTCMVVSQRCLTGVAGSSNVARIPFTPTAAGTFDVHVTLTSGAVEARGSPASGMVVTAAVPDVGKSSVDATTLTGFTVGTRATIVVDVRDAFGNVVSASSSVNLVAQVVSAAGGATSLPAAVQGSRFALTWTPKAVGSATLNVTIGGVAITGSGAKLTVAPGATSASQSYVQRLDGADLKLAAAGATVSAAVYVVDVNGNPQDPSQSDTVTVSLTSPTGGQGSVITPTVSAPRKDASGAVLSPTSYLIQFSINTVVRQPDATVSPYTLTVQVNGANVKGSPFSVYPYSSVASGAQSYLVDGTTGARVTGTTTLTAGQASHVTVQLVDANGNQTVYDPTRTQPTVTATLYGTLADTPGKGVVYSTEATVAVPAGQGGDLAGTTATVPASNKVTATDDRNGRWTLTLTPLQTASLVLVVSVGGSAINGGASYAVTVAPGVADVTRFTLAQASGSTAPLVTSALGAVAAPVAGQPAWAVVQPRDGQGNLITDASAFTVLATVSVTTGTPLAGYTTLTAAAGDVSLSTQTAAGTGDGTNVPSVLSWQAGQAVLKFKPPAACRAGTTGCLSLTLQVSFNGQVTSAPPIALTVAPGAVAGLAVSGPGSYGAILSDASAGLTATVVPVDASGSPVDNLSSYPAVTVTSAKIMLADGTVTTAAADVSATVTAADASCKCYTLTWKAAKAGTLSLTLEYEATSGIKPTATLTVAIASALGGTTTGPIDADLAEIEGDLGAEAGQSGTFRVALFALAAGTSTIADPASTSGAKLACSALVGRAQKLAGGCRGPRINSKQTSVTVTATLDQTTALTVTQGNDGMHSVAYKLKSAGQHYTSLRVTVGTAAPASVQGYSQAAIPRVYSGPHASWTTLLYDPVTMAVLPATQSTAPGYVGVPFTVDYVSTDAYGNAVDGQLHAPLVAQVKLTLPDGSTQGVVAATPYTSAVAPGVAGVTGALALGNLPPAQVTVSRLQYRPTALHVYSVSGYLSTNTSQSVGRSVSVDVGPGLPSVAKSSVAGTSVESALAGTTVQFTVALADDAGTPLYNLSAPRQLVSQLQAAPSAVKTSLSYEAQKLVATPATNVLTQAVVSAQLIYPDGTKVTVPVSYNASLSAFQGALTSQKAGTAWLDLQVFGQDFLPVGASGSVVVQPLSLSGATSFEAGPATGTMGTLAANKAAGMYVQARDRYGNDIQAGGLSFQASATQVIGNRVAGAANPSLLTMQPASVTLASTDLADGQYLLSVTIPITGSFNLTVQRGSEQLSPSATPYIVDTGSGAMAGAQSTVGCPATLGSGEQCAVPATAPLPNGAVVPGLTLLAGVPALVVVSARDAAQVPTLGTAEDIEVYFSAGSGETELASAKSLMDTTTTPASHVGQFQATFTPLKAGPLVLTVRQRGTTWRVTGTVVPGAMSNTQSQVAVATSPSEPVYSTGRQPQRVTVAAYDANGNRVTSAARVPDTVYVELRPDDGSSSGRVFSAASALGNGYFAMAYETQVPVVCHVFGRIGEQGTGFGNVPLQVVAGPAVLSNTVVQGSDFAVNQLSSTTAGQASTMYVSLRDMFNNVRMQGSDVYGHNDASVPPSPFLPSASMVLRITGVRSGAAVDVPFTVTFNSAAVVAACVKASDGSAAAKLTCDSKLGLYQVDFTPTTAGSLRFDMYLKGSQLLAPGGSSFAMTVLAGAPSGAAAGAKGSVSRVYSIGLDAALQGDPNNYFDVQVLDQYGNPVGVLPSGWDIQTTLTLQGSGPDLSKVNTKPGLVDVTTSTFRVFVSFPTNTTGARYNVTVTVQFTKDGNPQANGYVCRAATDVCSQGYSVGVFAANSGSGVPANSVVTDQIGNILTPGGTPLSAVVGVPVQMKVIVRDANLVPTASSVGLTSAWLDFPTVSPASLDLRVPALTNGSVFTFSWTSDVRGRQVVYLTANGRQPIGQDSATGAGDAGMFVVEWAAEAATSQAQSSVALSGPPALGGTVAQVAAGAPLHVVVQPRDQYGNAQPYQATVGPRPFTASLVNAATKTPTACQIAPQQSSGWYDVICTATSVGTYSLQVLNQGAAASASDALARVLGRTTLAVTVVAGPYSPAATTLVPDVRTAAALPARAGAASSVVVVPLDAYGNAVTTYVAPALQLTAASLPSGADVSAALDASVLPSAGGQFSATFFANASGSYLLTVKEASSPVVIVRPFLVTVTSGAVSVASTVLSGAGLAGAKASSDAVVFVQLYDSSHNPMTDPTSVPAITAQISAPGQAPSADQSALTYAVSTAQVPVQGIATLTYRVSVPGSYGLHISVAGVEAAGSPFAIAVSKADAPAVVTGYPAFRPDGASLAVLFDVPTNRGAAPGASPTNDCATIFDAATLATLGSLAAGNSTVYDSSCTWPTPQQLVVLLGTAPTLRPTSLDPTAAVAFKTGALTNSAGNSFAVTGQYKVLAPSSTPQPRVRISAPTVIGVCDDLVVDASGSRGGLGRGLTYVFAVQGSTTADTTSAGQALQLTGSGQVNASAATSGVFTVPSSYLRAGGIYTVTVTVTNFFGAASQAQGSVTVTRLSVPAPRVAVRGGLSSLSIDQSQPFVVAADVTAIDPSQCAGTQFTSLSASATKAMTFQWQLTSGPAITAASFPNPTAFAAYQASLSSRVLSLPGNVLQAGQTYTFTFTAAPSTAGMGSYQGQTAVTIAVTSTAIRARILGGDATLPAGLPFNVTAAPVDPDGARDPVTGAATPFTFQWTCETVAPDASGVLQTTASSCFGSPQQDSLVLLPQATVAVTAANAALLKAGSQYRFTAQIAKEPLGTGRTASVSVLRSIAAAVTGTAPTHQVAILAPANPEISPASDLLLFARAIPLTSAGVPDPPNATFTWTLAAGSGPIASASTAASLSSGVPGRRLRVPAGQLQGGQTYTFHLAGGGVAAGTSATVSLTVSQAPWGGVLSVTTAATATSGAYAEGTAVFSASLDNWQAAQGDLPLTYQFSAIDAAGVAGTGTTPASLTAAQVAALRAANKERLLVPTPTEVSSAQFVLPAGTWVVVGTVTNGWGATTQLLFTDKYLLVARASGTGLAPRRRLHATSGPLTDDVGLANAANAELDATLEPYIVAGQLDRALQYMGVYAAKYAAPTNAGASPVPGCLGTVSLATATERVAKHLLTIVQTLSYSQGVHEEAMCAAADLTQYPQELTSAAVTAVATAAGALVSSGVASSTPLTSRSLECTARALNNLAAAATSACGAGPNGAADITTLSAVASSLTRVLPLMADALVETDPPVSHAYALVALSLSKDLADDSGTVRLAPAATLGARGLAMAAVGAGTVGEVVSLSAMVDASASDPTIAALLRGAGSPSAAQVTVLQRQMVPPPLSTTSTAGAVPQAVALAPLTQTSVTLSLGPGGVAAVAAKGTSRRRLSQAFTAAIAYLHNGALATLGLGTDTVTGDAVTTTYASLTPVPDTSLSDSTRNVGTLVFAAKAVPTTVASTPKSTGTPAPSDTPAATPSSGGSVNAAVQWLSTHAGAVAGIAVALAVVLAAATAAFVVVQRRRRRVRVVPEPSPPSKPESMESKAVVAVAVAKKESKEVSLVGNEDMYLPGTPKGARRPRAFEYSDSDSDNDYV